MTKTRHPPGQACSAEWEDDVCRGDDRHVCILRKDHPPPCRCHCDDTRDTSPTPTPA